MFPLGHSMGIDHAHALPEAQAVRRHVFGPAFTAVNPVSPYHLDRSMLRRLPKMGMLALNAHEVSRDPEVVADYLADPLVYNGNHDVLGLNY